MKKMRYCFFLILGVLTYFCFPAISHAQENNTVNMDNQTTDLNTSMQNGQTAEEEKPIILYNGTPKKYEIADIKVEGVKNYEDYVLIGISGLAVGQTITVPVSYTHLTLPTILLV